jgi:hypothetical protein
LKSVKFPVIINKQFEKIMRIRNNANIGKRSLVGVGNSHSKCNKKFLILS